MLLMLINLLIHLFQSINHPHPTPPLPLAPASVATAGAAASAHAPPTARPPPSRRRSGRRPRTAARRAATANSGDGGWPGGRGWGWMIFVDNSALVHGLSMIFCKFYGGFRDMNWNVYKYRQCYWECMFKTWDFRGIFTMKSDKTEDWVYHIIRSRKLDNFWRWGGRMIARTSNNWVFDLESGDEKERDQKKCSITFCLIIFLKRSLTSREVESFGPGVSMCPPHNCLVSTYGCWLQGISQSIPVPYVEGGWDWLAGGS